MERQKERTWIKKTGFILKHYGIYVFEYEMDRDVFTLLNGNFAVIREIPGFLDYLETTLRIHQKDRRAAADFFRNGAEDSIELRCYDKNGKRGRVLLEAAVYEEDGRKLFIGCQRDVTEEKKQEELLRKEIRRDALTGLYNQRYGREEINAYLRHKSPYASCGLLVLDIDYFKSVNDTYGHLFGDQVLTAFSDFLLESFDNGDVVMRSGGDEFVVLAADIAHQELVQKTAALVEGVRKLGFPGSDYSPSCSVGVCFLPENIHGLTYEHLFQNADWALYRAKEGGRNRYVFCDSVRRFETEIEETSSYPNIDARYLRGDVISTAFEIFEKTSSFREAMDLLLNVIGIRFQLDRITVIHTDVRGKSVSREFQWTAAGTPEVLSSPGSFTKEDFMTLFRSYDEAGTTVLQWDDMGQYSKEARDLLIQGDAKTVLYAAMYSEGKYVGAISYVVGKEKRNWSRERRGQLGEITKLISAHLAKNQAMNAYNEGAVTVSDYDSLTGLLSFSRFREEVERLIVGKYTTSHVMVYTDFEDFKYFNRKFGYSMGDTLLKEFSSFIIGTMENQAESYFTRVVADQFLLFMPFFEMEEAEERVDSINQVFVKQCEERYPGIRLRLRTGIYPVGPDCVSASAAIDAANLARRAVGHKGLSARVYNEAMDRRQLLEKEILSSIDEAMARDQIQVYMQPKFSLKDHSVTGAEALLRWRWKDGTLLMPDVLIPVLERSGRIIDLDFYVFEKVAAFLEKNGKEGKRQYPVSVNASALHIQETDTAERYLEILGRYQVTPALLEIELTETAIARDYANVRTAFEQLRKAGIRISMDDFGSGYSVLNSIIDIPVDTVKLDRAFLASCAASGRKDVFLKALVGMIQGLGYHVICEGVEEENQLRLLESAGCTEAQGYWFARPMPLEDYEKMLPVEKETP